ncbi:MAG: helix-turn-helix transcriptional regulator [Ruminococcaceae bacterium]|nr:helix-turn-helix transcriptional regulator [Oscillospiraceae bacterium]
MNIGEKIRELRVAKLMTQSELAGTRITRNMLSCIENGSAQPSLSTILYIAGRLNVPVGFLLAEEGDEVVYRKMNSMPNIKRAYTAGDWWGCRSLCLSGCPVADDEISLLLAKCDAEIAVEEFEQGRLHSSCRFFDEALDYAEKTIYPTNEIEARALVYFRYMQRLSPTLFSDMLDSDKTLGFLWQSPFAAYVEVLEALDRGEQGKAIDFLSVTDETLFYADHIRVRLLMDSMHFYEAKQALRALLDSENPLNKVDLYTVLCELEVCCRETDDYRSAYNYATEKMQLLEQLLKEI